MTKTMGVGIIGCGNISTDYMELGPLFKGFTFRACADNNHEAATGLAEQFGIDAVSIDQLLQRDDIDIVLNLTTPAAHYEVLSRSLDCGKHVYSEKPFVLSQAEGIDLIDKANKAKLRIGSAPDTFMGASHQLARALVDRNRLGKILSGTAIVQGPGMESWHPNPDFFFLPGAGPVLDIGPYYVSNLVQLIGPVKEVMAMGSSPTSQRTIGDGPREGEQVPVKVDTTIHALLRFQSGAQVTMITSWDVQSHSHGNMELYGEKGTLYIPDPNFFGGEVTYTEGDEIKTVSWDHPFAKLNYGDENEHANYRCAGLADMALAIAEGRPHRCSAEFAHHVVDVMTGILTACETGKTVSINSSCEQPEPVDGEAARALMV